MSERLRQFYGRVHTTKAANGKEFADRKRIAGDLEAKFYFVTPYHSMETRFE